MPQEDEYSPKIQHLFDKVNIYDHLPSFLASIKDVPRPLLLLYAAHFCLSEVHNGGFLQLFWNSTGVLVPYAVEGFEALGMAKLSATFASAAAMLGSPYPQERQERWDALLRASQKTVDGFDRISDPRDLYVAYGEATATLPLEVLDKEAWELAESENGGFQVRADSYAARLEPERKTH